MSGTRTVAKGNAKMMITNAKKLIEAGIGRHVSVKLVRIFVEKKGYGKIDEQADNMIKIVNAYKKRTGNIPEFVFGIRDIKFAHRSKIERGQKSKFVEEENVKITVENNIFLNKGGIVDQVILSEKSENAYIVKVDGFVSPMLFRESELGKGNE
jgi:hypothetical protein